MLWENKIANLDSVHDSYPDRTKSIRKMMRAIIETVGGDGKKVRNEQMKGASYHRGKVYFQGERVAEWDEGASRLAIRAKGSEFQWRFKL